MSEFDREWAEFTDLGEIRGSLLACIGLWHAAEDDFQRRQALQLLLHAMGGMLASEFRIDPGQPLTELMMALRDLNEGGSPPLLMPAKRHKGGRRKLSTADAMQKARVAAAVDILAGHPKYAPLRKAIRTVASILRRKPEEVQSWRKKVHSEAYGPEVNRMRQSLVTAHRESGRDAMEDARDLLQPQSSAAGN